MTRGMSDKRRRGMMAAADRAYALMDAAIHYAAAAERQADKEALEYALMCIDASVAIHGYKPDDHPTDRARAILQRLIETPEALS